LESVLVSGMVEGEVDGSIWSKIGNFGLERYSQHMIVRLHISKWVNIRG
jgi:hypothetical protein